MGGGRSIELLHTRQDEQKTLALNRDSFRPQGTRLDRLARMASCSGLRLHVRRLAP